MNLSDFQIGVIVGAALGLSLLIIGALLAFAVEREEQGMGERVRKAGL